MASVRAETPPSIAAQGSVNGSWRARAFGLDVEGAFPAPGLASGGTAGSTRPTSLQLVPDSVLDAVWRPDEAARIDELRWSDGDPARTVDRHPELGYLMFGDGFGRYLISADGSRIDCVPARVQSWRWQRWLIGQILPLAAVVQGLESFHASAVGLGERAVAFVGDTRAGKTSVAVNLVLRGASFIADDVVVVESEGDRLMTHPGAGIASLRHEEARLISPERLERLGRVVGRDDEALRITIDREDRALPLAAIYFLAREDERERIEFEAVSDPRLLLASTFNFCIRTPERLRNQLDVCARLASTTAMLRASIPPSVTASDLAESIEGHMEAVL